MTANARPRALDDAQIVQFIREGFIRIDNAFPRDLAEAARAIMWRDLPCSEHDPSTWIQPVIRLPGYGDAPFRDAINTAVLHTAFDQIVGTGGIRAATSARFQCAFRIRTILAMPAGMST